MPSAPILLTVLLALAPAVVAWRTGRAVVRRLDDPAVGEMLLARRQRLGTVTAVCVVLLVLTGVERLLWSLPVLLLLFLAVQYPVRRALLGETWSFGAYAWRTVCAFIASFGLFLLIGLAPTIIQRAGASTRVAAGLGALMIGWWLGATAIWVRLNGASPLPEGELRIRLQEVRARSRVPAVEIYRFGPPGSRLVNAFALPWGGRPAVAFTHALLEMLSPAEVAAVFAHELAHLEHFSGARRLRMRVTTALLIVIAISLPLLARRLAPDVGDASVGALWPLVVLVALVARGARSRKHETESDLRALALTGELETLIRALTEIHVANLLPRRWAPDFERRATHPSLARRIQVLRRAAGADAPAPSIAAATFVRSTTAGQWVVLETARAHWLDGVPADAPSTLEALRDRATSVRTFAYEMLTELRVVPSGNARALRATDCSGRSWSVALDPADVSRVQHTLDVVDVGLAAPAAHSTTAPRLVAVAMLFAALVGGSGVVMLAPAVLAFLLPGAVSLGALAAVALGGVLLVPSSDDPMFALRATSVAITVVLAVLAARAAWVGHARARAEATPSTNPRAMLVPAILGVLAFLVALAVVWAARGDALEWDVAAEPALAGARLGLGAGVALAVAGPGRVRWAGATLAIVALAGAVIAAYGERIVHPVPRIAWHAGRADTVARATISEPARQLRVSPGGARFAVAPERQEGRGAHTFVVGDFRGERHGVLAQDLEFLDDSTLVALVPAGERWLMELRRADSGSAALWRDTLPELALPELSVEGESGRWMVAGEDVESDDRLLVSGRLGERAHVVRRIRSDSSMGGRLIMFHRGERVLFAAPALTTTISPLMIFGASAFRWRLWEPRRETLHARGSVPGLPTCARGGADAATVCVVQGPRGMSVWRVSERGESTALTRLGPEVGPADVGADGLVAVVPYRGTELLLVNGSAARGVRVPVGGAGYTRDVRVISGGVAVLRWSAGGSTIAIVRVK